MTANANPHGAPDRLISAISAHLAAARDAMQRALSFDDWSRPETALAVTDAEASLARAKLLGGDLCRAVSHERKRKQVVHVRSKGGLSRHRSGAGGMVERLKYRDSVTGLLMACPWNHPAPKTFDAEVIEP